MATIHNLTIRNQINGRLLPIMSIEDEVTIAELLTAYKQHLGLSSSTSILFRRKRGNQILPLDRTIADLEIQDTEEFLAETSYVASGSSNADSSHETSKVGQDIVISSPPISTTRTNELALQFAMAEIVYRFEETLKVLELTRQNMVSTLKEEISELRQDRNEIRSTTEKLREEVSRLRDVLSASKSVQGADEAREEIEHQTLIRKELIKRLRALEIEQARKGINTPAETEIQIGDIRDRMSEAEARIKILIYDLGQIKELT